VPIVNETIPHEVRAKFGASYVLLKPAVRGSGIKAGGAVRAVLEVAGIPNVSGKILGSQNKINNVKATFKALRNLAWVEGEAKKGQKPLHERAGDRKEKAANGSNPKKDNSK